MMNHTVRTALVPVLTLALGAVAGRWSAPPAEPNAFTPGGYSFELTTDVPVAPEVAWDHFTGDVSPWWDHHFVTDPKKLEIGRTPGSSFVEVFDDQGHGAEHARVTHAIRGEMLRMVGPLGLVGYGVEIDAIVRFAADGDGTRVKLSAFVHGKVDAGVATAIEGVWKHFLVERYGPYVRGL